MKYKMPSRKFILTSLSLLVAMAVLLSVVPAVYAEGDAPISPIPGLGRIPNVTLVRMHKQEGGWYSDQDALIKQSDALAKAFQSLIDAEKKHGKNVSILENGLATFESEVAASREVHLVAGGFIYSLVGFKVNGDVRDRLEAGQQLINGRASLHEAHVRLVMAMTALEKSYAEWRHSRVVNNPPFIPTATPKP